MTASQIQVVVHPQSVIHSLVRTKDGKIVRDAQNVQIGEELEIIPAHGTIRAQVTECL